MFHHELHTDLFWITSTSVPSRLERVTSKDPASVQYLSQNTRSMTHGTMEDSSSDKMSEHATHVGMGEFCVEQRREQQVLIGIGHCMTSCIFVSSWPSCSLPCCPSTATSMGNFLAVRKCWQIAGVSLIMYCFGLSLPLSLSLGYGSTPSQLDAWTEQDPQARRGNKNKLGRHSMP